jgi:S-DNA-T family DNA segregation ATPase FtsK/SpoIIIE
VEHAVLGPADTARLGDSVIAVTPVTRHAGASVRSSRQSRSGGGRPCDLEEEEVEIPFNRSPRVVPRFDPPLIRVPQPPRRPGPQFFPFLLLLAPLIIGPALFLVTGSPYTLLFLLMMPLMVVAGFLNRKSQTRRTHAFQEEVFSEQLESVRDQVLAAQDGERAVRLACTPSTAEAVDAALRRGRLLWTHRPGGDGFLTVSLGLGAPPSLVDVQMPEEHDTSIPFWDRLQDLRTLYRNVPHVPVVGDLRACGSIGIAGDGERALGATRALMAQLVCLHSPAELVITAFASRRSSGPWAWLGFLPHTASPHSPLPGMHLADTPTVAAGLLEELESLVARRAQQPRSTGDGSSSGRSPAVVVLIQDDAPVDRARLVQLALEGPEQGVHVLWHSPTLGELPAACRCHLEVREGSADGLVGIVPQSRRLPLESVEELTVAQAEDLARHLAPVVDGGVPVRDDSDLPDQVTFLSLVNGRSAGDAEAVLQAWTEQEPATGIMENSLRAVVGHDGRAPWELDLRAQGPHALVGGTTGSGKSEFLQTWVLSLASRYSPRRVTFLLVDYKGGAAFGACEDLPHTVGLVTDLSGHLVHRALTSLRAELRWREHLLQRHGVKDLRALELSRDEATPPSLVIVVDEFAALAQEIPEFVDGVVDIAARGRSLGLHLILATQRPAGVIKDNLRANTNLRVALRTADAADSLDVLGDPVAARFDPALPGRAAVRTGPGRVRTFQTAHVGGWTRGSERSRITIDQVRFAHGPAPVLHPFAAASGGPEDLSPVPSDPGPTDLERIVATIARAAAQARVASPRRPWLPPLPNAVGPETLPAGRRRGELLLGLCDRPEDQAQDLATLAPSMDGTFAVIGAGGSGRSATLRTLALEAGLASLDGDPTWVYAVDAGGSGLRVLEDLPHVGAVLAGEDEDAVIRLLTMLQEIVEDRAARFAAVRAGSIEQFRERVCDAADTTDPADGRLPRILLLLDNLGTFRAHWEEPRRARHVNTLVHLAAEGRAVGVHLALTVDRFGAVPSALAATVRRRFVLRPSSEEELFSLGLARDALPADAPPGRGILDGHETQVAVPGGSGDLGSQARALAVLGERLRHGGQEPAPGVRTLPEQVEWDRIHHHAGGRIMLGLADETLDEVGIAPRGAFMVAGPMGSGRTGALLTLAHTLRCLDPAPALVHLAPRPTELSGSGLWSLEGNDPAQVTALATAVRDLAEDAVLSGRRCALFLEAASDLCGNGKDAEIERLVRDLLRRGHLVVAESENGTWSQAYPLIQIFRAGRRGLLLRPSEADGESLLGTSLPRHRPVDGVPGRGYLIESGSAVRLQMVQHPDRATAPTAVPVPVSVGGR